MNDPTLVAAAPHAPLISNGFDSAKDASLEDIKVYAPPSVANGFLPKDVTSRRQDDANNLAVSPSSVLCSDPRLKEFHSQKANSNRVDDDEISASVSAMLADSVAEFHLQGPLINPLALSEMKPTHRESIRQRLSMVCDAKDFGYAIFWAPDLSKNRMMVAEEGYCMSNNQRKGCSTELFYQSSKDLFGFPVGLDIVGRVAYKGGYEWCCNVQQQPVCGFHRVELAKVTGLETVCCCMVKGGVVEIGTRRRVADDPHIINYINIVFNS